MHAYCSFVTGNVLFAFDIIPIALQKTLHVYQNAPPPPPTITNPNHSRYELFYEGIYLPTCLPVR